MENFTKPMTPTETRATLESLGHSPKQSLGQNFLIDANIVRKSIELANIKKGDAIVEVGPGLGTLTHALLQEEASVFAVEKDNKLFEFLTEKFSSFKTELSLINADAIDFPLAKLPTKKPFKIVANLPYAIATPWVEKVLSGTLPETMVLMLQKEAAERFIATPGSKQFGAISLFINSAFTPTAKHKVSGSCFYPKPDVESLLLKLTRNETPFIFNTETKHWVRRFFTQRRKQIKGLLREAIPEEPKLQTWLTHLETNNVATARPEAIPITHWQKLQAYLKPEA